MVTSDVVSTNEGLAVPIWVAMRRARKGVPVDELGFIRWNGNFTEREYAKRQARLKTQRMSRRANR